MMNGKLYVYILLQLQMIYLIASGSTLMKKLSTGVQDTRYKTLFKLGMVI